MVVVEVDEPTKDMQAEDNEDDYDSGREEVTFQTFLLLELLELMEIILTLLNAFYHHIGTPPLKTIRNYFYEMKHQI